MFGLFCNFVIPEPEMDYANTGGMRSPFSPRVRQSIAGRRGLNLGSAKKNSGKFMEAEEVSNGDGDVVYKTSLLTVQTCGVPLPVTVTEALTFGGSGCSARAIGAWCWVVAGRRALCWRRDTVAPARILTLPQTDLAHKADLVTIFYQDDAQMPSCIGVSPEGVIRYWPSIGQEAVYVDVTAELAGQECERLGDYSPAGLVLATTTCTVHMLTPTTVDGRACVSWTVLRTAGGWLGGLSRRVSVLFFGSMPHADTKLVGVVSLPATSEAPEEPHLALVASGGVLQVWRNSALHTHALHRPLVDAFLRAHMLPPGEASNLEAAVVDVCGGGGANLLLLLSAHTPLNLRYAIAHVSLEDPTKPVVTSVAAIRAAPRPELRLLPLGRAPLLYTNTCFAALPCNGPADKVEWVDVSSEGDCIVGAALVGSLPLLFSAKHGLLQITQTYQGQQHAAMCDSPIASPCPSDIYEGNLSLYEIDPNEISLVATDACGKLKTAFLYHVRRDQAACKAILDELFPAAAERDVDAPLDRCVLAVAREMLDDMPAGDPRWVQCGGAGRGRSAVPLGASAALAGDAQLRDKRRALAMFAGLLRAANLHARLASLTYEGGQIVSTTSALCALSEQLAAAITLRRLQTDPQYSALIDAAVYQVVCADMTFSAEEDPFVMETLRAGALTPHDVCFRRVSCMRTLLLALTISQAVLPACSLLTLVLREMHNSRNQWGVQPPPDHQLLNALIDLVTRTVSETGNKNNTLTSRAQLLEAAYEVAQLLLEDASRLSSNQTEEMRRRTIQPFLDAGDKERAAVLAEKFGALELLVSLCIDTNNMERLYQYIDKYSDKGMANLAFARLYERGGKHRAALIREVGVRLPAQLHAWLERTPERLPMLAAAQLSARNYEKAANALFELANEERDSVGRMTTMASLAKLCLLASDEGSEETWLAVESKLCLGEQHAALPRHLRMHHDLPHDDCPVLPPEDIVQMYVQSESEELTEYDYKKALDITDLIEDPELREDLRLKIWCACILRDAWLEKDDRAAESLADKLFFRLVDLVHVMGGDLALLLPTSDAILSSPELATLNKSPNFRYLLKLGYERISSQPMSP